MLKSYEKFMKLKYAFICFCFTYEFKYLLDQIEHALLLSKLDNNEIMFLL